MFVWATRRASIITLRALFYVSLFFAVVVLQVAGVTTLRGMGWNGGLSLTVSGALVLALVLAANYGAEQVRKRRAAAREAERARLGLPEGPACVVWRAGAGDEEAMPWTPLAPLRAPYPPLARRLGVEGVAVVDFEIGADGAPRHIHCVDSWPSEVFFEAAQLALKDARFEEKPGKKARFGVSYRMPFVFRIAGFAQIKEHGRRALPHRPALFAAARAVEQLAKRA